MGGQKRSEDSRENGYKLHPSMDSDQRLGTFTRSYLLLKAPVYPSLNDRFPAISDHEEHIRIERGKFVFGNGHLSALVVVNRKQFGIEFALLLFLTPLFSSEMSRSMYWQRSLDSQDTKQRSTEEVSLKWPQVHFQLYLVYSQHSM